MRVDIYSKPACSLCDAALEVVERVRARIPFELRLISILEDPALVAAYRYDIPVVSINGQAAFKHRVEEAELEAYLLQVLNGTQVAHSPARDE